MLKWQGWEFLNRKETLIIFVGNGAQIVKDFINREKPDFLKDWDNVKVDARREWEPGENPRAYVDTIGNKKQFFLKYKNIIVIDDVISSGSTIQKLYKENEVYFPSAKWRFLSWVSLPITKKIEKIAYETYSSEIIEFYDGVKKPPINSLSTLVEKPSRAENYAKRNIAKYEAFLKILKGSVI